MSRVVAVDADGSDRVELSGFDDRAGPPSLNGDGSRIVFASDGDPLGLNPDRNPEIFVVNRDASGLAQLTQTTDGVNWSPSITLAATWSCGSRTPTRRG